MSVPPAQPRVIGAHRIEIDASSSGACASRPLIGQSVFRAAAATLVLAAATGLVALGIPAATQSDANALNGFWLLQRTGWVHVANLLPQTVNLIAFVGVTALLTIVAVLRRRPREAAATVMIMAGANLSTEALKAVLPGRSFVAFGHLITTIPSFPSGHATASMSLVLCLLVVAPPRLRRSIAPGGLMYALAVGYSTVTLGFHLPSDVIGGYLVAAVWALVGAAYLRRGTGRDLTRTLRHRRPEGWTPDILVVLGAVVATAAALHLGPDQPAPAAFAIASLLITASAVISLRLMRTALSSD